MAEPKWKQGAPVDTGKQPKWMGGTPASSATTEPTAPAGGFNIAEPTHVDTKAYNDWRVQKQQWLSQDPKRASSDDDLAIMFGYKPEDIYQKPGYKPGDLMNLWKGEGGGVEQKASPMTRFFSGAVKGVEDTFEGGAQMARRALQGVGSKGKANVQYGDLAISIRNLANKLRYPDNTAGTLGSIVGPAVLPMPQGGRILGGGFGQGVKGVAKSAGIGAGFAALQPVNVDPRVEGDFAQQKTGQVVTGAIMAPVMQTGVEGAGKAISSGLDKLAFTKLGKRLGLRTEVKPEYVGGPDNPSAMDRAKELESVGIKNILAGDTTGDLGIRKMEDALVRNDPKLLEFRQGTNRQASDYAQAYVDRLKGAVKSKGWKGVDQLEAEVASNGKRAKEAQSLLDAIAGTGEDMAQTAKKGAQLELLLEKMQADVNFDKAEAISKLYGPVKQSNYTQALKSTIDRIGGNKALDQSQLPYLQGLLEDATAGRNVDFATMRQTRTALNGKIQGLSSPGVPVPDVNASKTALQDVTKALEKDLDTFASGKSPELKSAWKTATDHYREKVVPYKAKDMAKPLGDDDPLALLGMFDKKQPYEQKRMLGLIGDKGRLALQAAKIQNAVDAGGKTQRGVAGIDSSPMAIANRLERDKANGVLDVLFPKGVGAYSPEGMIRIMRGIDRVSDLTGASTTTGRSAQEIGAAVKGDATALGLGQKLMSYFQGENLKKLYMDPKGRVLLKRASVIDPKSKMMERLITVDVPRFFGTTGGKIATQESTPVIDQQENQ